MKFSKSIIVALMVGGIVCLTVHFTSFTVFASEQPKFIKIAASSMGGAWFPLCAATAEVLNQNIPGTVFTATLGGGISNLKNIAKGTLYMGMSTSTSAYLASRGIDPFTEKSTKLKTLAMYYAYPYNLVVRANSKIQSINDLAGKNVGVGSKGWATEVFFSNLLMAYGMSYETIKKSGGNVSFTGWSQMRTMFQDRKLDLIVDPGNVPSPGIMEITSFTPIRLIDIGSEGIQKLQKLNPGYTSLATPGGLYQGQDKEVTCAADPAGLVISAEIPDDMAYEITKAIFDNSEKIKQVHGVLKDFSVKNALHGAYLPLHQGAYRYYQEKGVSIPEHLKP